MHGPFSKILGGPGPPGSTPLTSCTVLFFNASTTWQTLAAHCVWYGFLNVIGLYSVLLWSRSYDSSMHLQCYLIKYLLPIFKSVPFTVVIQLTTL